MVFHLNMARDEMAPLIAQCRFGIHGMMGEHFGAAPAEIQRAGRVMFVPQDHGSVEIVGNDEPVIYRTLKDGIDKIVRM